MIAFGGGLLLAAVALVLVPEGMRVLPTVEGCAWFFFGGLAFFGLERLQQHLKGNASQLIATLSDYLPESVAMGAGFASGKESGYLLALLIGLQNLPEGFNAFREIRSSWRISRA
ncbi:MAG: divalent cation transporter, partial [Bdellovibrionota bacterium]